MSTPRVGGIISYMVIEKRCDKLLVSEHLDMGDVTKPPSAQPSLATLGASSSSAPKPKRTSP